VSASFEWADKRWTIAEIQGNWIAGGRRYRRVLARDELYRSAIFDLVKLDDGSWTLAGMEVIDL
jgi:hypothetical protein